MYLWYKCKKLQLQGEMKGVKRIQIKSTMAYTRPIYVVYYVPCFYLACDIDLSVQLSFHHQLRIFNILKKYKYTESVYSMKL